MKKQGLLIASVVLGLVVVAMFHFNLIPFATYYPECKAWKETIASSSGGRIITCGDLSRRPGKNWCNAECRFELYETATGKRIDRGFLKYQDTVTTGSRETIEIYESWCYNSDFGACCKGASFIPAANQVKGDCSVSEYTRKKCVETVAEENIWKCEKVYDQYCWIVDRVCPAGWRCESGTCIMTCSERGQYCNGFSCCHGLECDNGICKTPEEVGCSDEGQACILRGCCPGLECSWGTCIRPTTTTIQPTTTTTPITTTTTLPDENGKLPEIPPIVLMALVISGGVFVAFVISKAVR